MYCDKKHVLGYSDARFKKICEECKQEKVTCLFCTECRPMRSYCLKCRPTDWQKTCYFNDPLTKKEIAEEEDAHQCLVCQEAKKSDMWWCKYCKFEICEACRTS